MTLLQVNTNRDLGSLDYAQKRPTLLESNFEITRKLAEDYSEWTPEAISKWQKYLANQATAIWRVAQLN